jgi:hypothetical protein
VPGRSAGLGNIGDDAMALVTPAEALRAQDEQQQEIRHRCRFDPKNEEMRRNRAAHALVSLMAQSAPPDCAISSLDGITT